MYPAGVTTNSAQGVTDVTKMGGVFRAMAACDFPLLVHGEVNDPSVDIFDREARFIEDILKPLHKALPSLKIVFEHITTRVSHMHLHNFSFMMTRRRWSLLSRVRRMSVRR